MFLSGSGEENENVKTMTTTTMKTDNGQISLQQT